MELLETIVYLVITGAILGPIMFIVARVFPHKTAKKALDKTIIQQNEVIQGQSEFIKDNYQSQIKSLSKQLRDATASNDTEDEEEPLPVELIAPIAKRFNMDPNQISMLLNNPQVKKMLGGKNSAQTLAAIAPLLSGLGGGNPTQSQQIQGGL